ncbi:MAG: hypothetical protein HQL87_17070 [Magnetococcales bacterium]|nr:hypothetical protein [Magnetococcales bacterium]
MTAETIDHTTLARLAASGVVHAANVVGVSGGWGVVIQYGMAEHSLAAHRGAIRVFRKFETLVAYLKGLGIVQYAVDAAHYDPNVPTEHKRPDAANRMRRAYAAAEHDAWFREQVQQAVVAADQPDAVFISHAQVKAAWASRRAELLQCVDGTSG